MSRRAVSSVYGEARAWLADDWRRVEKALDGQAEAFYGKRILLTGAAGFLGFNLLHFFAHLNTRKTKEGLPVRVLAVDNYLRGRPRWIVDLATASSNIELRRFDGFLY